MFTSVICKYNSYPFYYINPWLNFSFSFMALWCVFLTFVDFILKKVITFVWKKMRCWFVLIPNFFGAELSFSTVPKCLGAELSFSTGTEMSWCRTVLFLFGVATLLKEFFHYVVTTRLIGNRNTQTVIQTWLRNPMPWKPEHLRWVICLKLTSVVLGL